MEVDPAGGCAYSAAMKTPILSMIVFAGLMQTASGAAAEGLGKYQLILDKQLLGIEKVTPAPAAVSAPVVAEASWSRDYRMTMITQDEDKLRVGLQNLKDQSAVLLIEGENSYPDFRLLSGNYQQGIARVSYRGVEHQFMIESGPAPASATPANRPGSSNWGNRPRPGGTSSSPRSGSPRMRTGEESSGETPPQPQVRTFQSREELQAHLQEQQMDAIRTGKPPLPIPLTRQMDDQLVKEGVLPAQ